MKLTKLTVIIFAVLISGCVVNNAYDFHNFENIEEGLEAATKQDVLLYDANIQLFSRNEVQEIKHDGTNLKIHDKFMESSWTHGILNYPLVILYDGGTRIIDLNSQTEMVNSDTIKKNLRESFEILVNNQDLRYGHIPISYKDFNKITVAQYCPSYRSIAFIIETEYRIGTTYSTIGFYNVQNNSIEFTNLSKGGFIPLGYGGDVGPFWSPNGYEYAYTLGDSADSARFLFVDCHESGNVIQLNGEVLQKHLELGEKSLYFPGFKNLKWQQEGKKLFFSTRAHDNSENSLNWVLDVSTGLVELLN